MQTPYQAVVNRDIMQDHKEVPRVVQASYADLTGREGPGSQTSGQQSNKKRKSEESLDHLDPKAKNAVYSKRSYYRKKAATEELHAKAESVSQQNQRLKAEHNRLKALLDHAVQQVELHKNPNAVTQSHNGDDLMLQQFVRTLDEQTLLRLALSAPPLQQPAFAFNLNFQQLLPTAFAPVSQDLRLNPHVLNALLASQQNMASMAPSLQNKNQAFRR